MAKLLIKWFQVAIVAGSLILATGSWADDYSEASDNTERPSTLTMFGDMFFARPIGLIMTVTGTALFVVSLPATLLTGTVGEAGASLVGDPVMFTFVRCLGCTETGWRKLPSKEEMPQ